MSDAEIEAWMYAHLNLKKGEEMWFKISDDCAHRITRIGKAPDPEPGDEPEPTVVAYTTNGKFIALDPAEFTDFKIVRPVG